MSNLTKLALTAAAVAVAGAAFAGGQPAQQGVSVRTDSSIANHVLLPQVGTGRELAILKLRQKDLANQTMYVGGIARAAALYSRLSNRSYKHTHVTNGFNSNMKKTATQFNMPEVALLGVADINDWTTAVLEYGAKNVGRSADGSDNLNLQQAYVILGNLNSSSIYGFAGKKEVDFGDFTSVNFYTQPLNQLAFRVAPTNSVGIGFDNSGLNVVATLINGGDNNSTSTADVGSATGNTAGTAYTQNSQNMNNFALNLAYGMNSNGVDWGVGAGYLNGARYNYRKGSSATPKKNAAWDVNGHFTVKNLHVLAEYNRTSGKAYNIEGGSSVEAYNIGAIYGFPLMGRKSAVNASFSRAQVTSIEATQFVLGWNNELYNNVWLGLEWAYNKGLMNGNANTTSNFATRDGISAIPSNEGAKNNTLLLNLTATF